MAFLLLPIKRGVTGAMIVTTASPYIPIFPIPQELNLHNTQNQDVNYHSGFWMAGTYMTFSSTIFLPKKQCVLVMTRQRMGTRDQVGTQRHELLPMRFDRLTHMRKLLVDLALGAAAHAISMSARRNF